MRERLADRPPRPLADAPTEPLHAALDGLAQAWIVELVAARPLTEVASLDLAATVADAPELCATIIDALAADAALERLAAAGDQAPLIARVCAAAADPVNGVTIAVELLRRVIWSAALEELRRPSPELVAALGDRLAHVCAIVAATAQAPRSVTPRGEFVLHDARPSAERLDRAGPEPATAASDEPGWSERLTAVLAQGPAGTLLLIDVDGHERLQAADGGPALQRAERALKRRLAEATLVRERLGRYWIASACVDGAEARRLASRLAEAVAGGEGHLGVPLTASVGFAVHDRLPNGEAAHLVCERAEEAMLSARAGGVRVDSR